MRKTVLFALMLGFVIGPSLFAQEAKKLKPDEAQQLITQYTQQETQLKAQLANEKADVENLKNEIAKLDDQISELEAKIEELKKEVEARSYYVVKPGDWLSKIAENPKIYGHGNYRRWKDIYNANKDLIKNPDILSPGWKLKIPRP